MSDGRRYIVGREGIDAVIREVDPSSCLMTMDWQTAKQLAERLASARKARKNRPGKEEGIVRVVDDVRHL